MTSTETVSGTDITFRRQGGGELALIFVHGFLDDHHVWDDVVAELADLPAEFIQVDLAGCGVRADAPGPYSYERLANDTSQIAASVNKPFVIVGQSMGAAVSELVAAGLRELALGLVLLTPVPLAGTQLPDSEMEPFGSLGEKGPEAKRLARRQLSFALSDEKLDQRRHGHTAGGHALARPLLELRTPRRAAREPLSRPGPGVVRAQ
jgi:pimeloyl-ACP methyl ester carboxylesterase